MKVFISWSGERSLAIANAIRGWIPAVLNSVHPYITSKDLDKGTVWSTEITTNLAAAQMGIICLTAENLTEPWVLFEAGALSRALPDKGRVYTYLLGLKATDIPPPLSLFQATFATEEDTFRLVKSINDCVAAAGEEAADADTLDLRFSSLWPRLEERIGNVPHAHAAPRPRDPRAISEEILETVRTMAHSQSQVHALIRRLDVSARVPSRPKRASFEPRPLDEPAPEARPPIPMEPLNERPPQLRFLGYFAPESVRAASKSRILRAEDAVNDPGDLFTALICSGLVDTAGDGVVVLTERGALMAESELLQESMRRPSRGSGAP
jgi:hypothetical protein